MKSHLVHHNGEDVFAVASLYQDGTSALILTDANGERVVTASTNLTEHFALAWDNLFIKDYSENEGTLKTLVEGGIVHNDWEDVVVNNPTRHVRFPHVRIIDKSILRELKKLRKQYKVDGATT